MTYYPTLAEDIARAKAIIDAGKPRLEQLQADVPDIQRLTLLTSGGAILGADLYAAYQLLESFVEVIETIGVDVCRTALRAKALRLRAEAGRVCPCNLHVPLDGHDRDPMQFAAVERLVAEAGEWITVEAGGKRWRVSRYCIALHGFKADGIASYGFEELP